MHQKTNFNVEQLEMDLKAVFDSSFDVIYVTDKEGTTLRVSRAAEELWGIKSDHLVGKSVYDLEANGVYSPSVSRLVLERTEKVQAIQTTSTGRRLMVVGTPIKDEEGKLTRVVNTSRDITKEHQMETELNDVKNLMEGYLTELEQLREKKDSSSKIISNSKPMQHVEELVNRVAGVDSTVLITGESGVGKEIIASDIQRQSYRKDKPYIKINCGALPENLLESELFGYEKGAFTGADQNTKKGMFELANGGTLFLDEIGDMSLATQIKLLRVLQEKTFYRLGGTKPISVDVRIIAATNQNLKDQIKKGDFREDLFYRLNVIPIKIPPLRERKEDIIPLALYFQSEFNRKYMLNKSLKAEVLEVFRAYHWPGNVRELKNMVERMVIISKESNITANELPEDLTEDLNSEPIDVHRIIPLQEAHHYLDIKILTMAKETYRSTSVMADKLGVNQSTISRKLKTINQEYE